MAHTRQWLAILAAASVVTTNAAAHHSLEYIDVESFNTSERGEALFYLQYDYMVPDGRRPDLDRWEITPGLVYGLTDRLMLDVHTHFAQFGRGHVLEEERESFGHDDPSPFFEAVSTVLLYRWTRTGPFHVATSVQVELPFRRARKLLGAADPVYAGMLILGREFANHANVVLNIGYEIEGSDDDWFWALGFRTPLTADPHGIAAGIEFQGDVDGNERSVMPGVFIPLLDTLQWKTGFEFGQEKDGDRWVNTRRFSTSVLHRF